MRALVLLLVLSSCAAVAMRAAPRSAAACPSRAPAIIDAVASGIAFAAVAVGAAATSTTHCTGDCVGNQYLEAAIGTPGLLVAVGYSASAVHGFRTAGTCGRELIGYAAPTP